MSESKSDADLCRANGWDRGTRLVAEENRGPTEIVITALGKDLVLAEMISYHGVHAPWGEGVWSISARDWQVVS